MELLYSGTPMNTNSGTSTATRSATTSSIFSPKKDYRLAKNQDPRDIVHDELSVINIITSLLAVSRWSTASDTHHTLPFDNWRFANEENMALFKDLLEGPASEEFQDMITLLLNTKIGNSRDNSNILSAVASNDVDDIIKRISDWNFDVNTLQSFRGQKCIIAAVQIKMSFSTWTPTIHLDKDYYYGQIMLFRNKDDFTVEMDQRGLLMGSYTLSLPCQDHNVPVKVRFTRIPSNYSEPFTLNQLVAEHRNGGFTTIPEDEISGLKIYGVNIPITNKAINRIMGATNNSDQIVACQSDGILEISNQTPLHFECRSVVVNVCRGMDSPDVNKHVEMYEMIYRKPWFNNLIEIIVGGHVHFACMCSSRHIKR